MNGSKPSKASPLAVVKTVLWAFLGIRKRTGHDEETLRLSPVQIIIAGVIAAAVFVASLILLVRFIIGNAGN